MKNTAQKPKTPWHSRFRFRRKLRIRFPAFKRSEDSSSSLPALPSGLHTMLETIVLSFRRTRCSMIEVLDTHDYYRTRVSFFGLFSARRWKGDFHDGWKRGCTGISFVLLKLYINPVLKIHQFRQKPNVLPIPSSAIAGTHSFCSAFET